MCKVRSWPRASLLGFNKCHTHCALQRTMCCKNSWTCAAFCWDCWGLLLAFSWGMFAMQSGRLREQDAAGCVMATRSLQCEWRSFGSWKGGSLLSLTSTLELCPTSTQEVWLSQCMRVISPACSIHFLQFYFSCCSAAQAGFEAPWLKCPITHKREDNGTWGCSEMSPRLPH